MADEVSSTIGSLKNNNADAETAKFHQQHPTALVRAMRPRARVFETPQTETPKEEDNG